MLVLQVVAACGIVAFGLRFHGDAERERREQERQARRAELAQLPRREEVTAAVVEYAQAVARRRLVVIDGGADVVAPAGGGEAA